MGCHADGGPSDVPAEERLNVFALVIYIPDPLGAFLDDLRRELVPDYNPHAHVSVLPPRPLGVDWRVASEQVRTRIEKCPPFDVELTRLAVFPVTDVLYLEVAAGAAELTGMHVEMSGGVLEFDEPFAYHPHVTLAQEVAHEEVERLRDEAARRWEAYRGPRVFRAERVTFVQNTMDNRWIDLAEHSLGALAVPQP